MQSNRKTDVGKTERKNTKMPESGGGTPRFNPAPASASTPASAPPPRTAPRGTPATLIVWGKSPAGGALASSSLGASASASGEATPSAKPALSAQIPYGTSSAARKVAVGSDVLSAQLPHSAAPAPAKPPASASSSGASRAAVGHMGIDRRAADDALYGSDDEQFDQRQRVATLTGELAKRKADAVKHGSADLTQNKYWNNAFGHAKAIRTVESSLASATSRVAGTGGVQHSEEFEQQRTFRLLDRPAQPSDKHIQERDAIRNAGGSPFDAPPSASRPGAHAPIPSRKSPAAPAAASSTPAAALSSPPVRGGAHAAPPSPRKEGE
ncbi:hypothetical protein [Burkholderia sp. 22PA0106]|uniref:hypothetical protein n=1 Tax=Burkholderia sp. 22PA0106 TaxID=3237371 RepID=UPI0039C2FF85